MRQIVGSVSFAEIASQVLRSLVDDQPPVSRSDSKRRLMADGRGARVGMRPTRLQRLQTDTAVVRCNLDSHDDARLGASSLLPRPSFRVPRAICGLIGAAALSAILPVGRIVRAEPLASLAFLVRISGRVLPTRLAVRLANRVGVRCPPRFTPLLVVDTALSTSAPLCLGMSNEVRGPVAVAPSLRVFARLPALRLRAFGHGAIIPRAQAVAA